MMKKVILFFTLFCVVTVLCGNAQALSTSQTLDNSTNPQWFLPDDSYPLTTNYYRNWYEDWGWTHTVSFNVDTLTETVEITGATLKIYAWDVDIAGDGFPELDEIRVGATSNTNGVSLGNLDGLDQDWYTTTFDLSLTPGALDKIVVNGDEGTLDVWMNISTLEPGSSYYPYWWVTLGNSKLIVQYDTVPIPAPGAVILVSLGAGLTGWLRKRRTL